MDGRGAIMKNIRCYRYVLFWTKIRVPHRAIILHLMFWYRCDEGSSHHFSCREHASRVIIYTSMKPIRAHRASLLEKLFAVPQDVREAISTFTSITLVCVIE